MNGLIRGASLAAVLAGAASASDLNLRVESGGAITVDVAPGETFDYDIVGELSDNSNEGLAFFVFDLEWSGGDLAQANDPAVASTMDVFSAPDGMNNPAGFGGTLSGGDLLQVGGAQNTINNIFGTKPLGGVTTGIAANGFPEVLVSGSITAPETLGTYQLRATNLHANVIKEGETGVPHWAVERTGVGPVLNLTVNVTALTKDAGSISVATGGTVNFALDAGTSHAGQLYILLGSATGTSPGTPLGSVTLPLNFDGYTSFTLSFANVPPLINTFNVLNGSGQSASSFTAGPLSPTLIGIQISNAYITLSPIDFASNAQNFLFLP